MVKCLSVYCVRHGSEHQFDRELCKCVLPYDEVDFIDDDELPDIPHHPDAKYFYGKPKSKVPYGCAPHSTVKSPKESSSQVVDKNPQDYINAFFRRWMAIEKREEILDNPMAPLVELSKSKDFGGHEINIAVFTLRMLPKDAQIGFVINLIAKGDAKYIKHIDLLAKAAEWVITGISTRLVVKIQDVNHRMAEYNHKLEKIKDDLMRQNWEMLTLCINVKQQVTKLEALTSKIDPK